MKKKHLGPVLVLLIASSLFLMQLRGEKIQSNSIFVYYNRERGAVNNKVFGSNLIGYDPETYEPCPKGYYGYSDYGAGIWDSGLKQSVKEAIDLAKSSGVSVARFPGGCGTHHYDWKKTIGEDRKHFLYGLDEFLTTCEKIGAEPVITLSYFTGDERDSADLVEYLNAPSDQAHKWALLRAKNGHSQPYGVKYFEIGNEVSHGDHQKIKRVLPEYYAHQYLKYYTKMKAIDPSIKIGVVLDSGKWNKEVLRIIKDNVGFGIIHIYPHPDVNKDKIKEINPKDIFKETLGLSVLEVEVELSQALTLMKEANKDMPLAITEYNAGFAGQEQPVPYRHCLGTALLNAELLRIFMKPEHNVLMANYWQFNNSYWGMISNGFDDNPKDLRNPYFKRPNYYVFEMYHKHFGDLLLPIDMQCDAYETQNTKMPYLSVNASKNAEGKKVYLMVINKNMDASMTATIVLKDFMPAVKGNAWVLNGPSVDATNEKKHDNVKIVHHEFETQGNSFEFTFEPHSLTAIEIERLDIAGVQ